MKSMSEEFDRNYKLVSTETGKYLPENQQVNLIYGTYGRLLGVISRFPELTSPYLLDSTKVAQRMAEWGFEGKFIASSLIYHAFIRQYLDESSIRAQFNEEANAILEILSRLTVLASLFENHLPWVNFGPNLNKAFKNKKLVVDSSRHWQRGNAKRQIPAFLGISKIPEIACIKLLDRLYLLRNLNSYALSADQTVEIAEETLEIFSPIAELLGIWTVKSELEDRCLQILEPRIYKEISKDLKENIRSRRARLERAINLINDLLLRHGTQGKVLGRPKHLYGIYSKIKNTGLSITQINDTLGIRIILESVGDCYNVLSNLQQDFHLADGIYEDNKKYRDWIANPKPNKYQSIHTTVIFEEQLIEVQIRTKEMDDLAEYGFAAHWVYKKAGNSQKQQKKYEEYVALFAEYRRMYESN